MSNLQPVTRPFLLYSNAVRTHCLQDILQPGQELKNHGEKKGVLPSQLTQHFALCSLHLIIELSHDRIVNRQNRHITHPLFSTIKPIRYKFTKLKHFIILFTVFFRVIFKQKTIMHVIYEVPGKLFPWGVEKKNTLKDRFQIIILSFLGQTPLRRERGDKCLFLAIIMY